ncbi:hypothetical protein PVOR_19009 [Paenibacillus vortex V453]|uniref:Uncharacterized protein n=1 Tax=Paenibacillus vortex V453 TaxID=715225 RepID=A0A2R9ST03_9BACL|nr:hypothetical protein PVOR_19009 [Paenibacillus vortex V453]
MFIKTFPLIEIIHDSIQFGVATIEISNFVFFILHLVRNKTPGISFTI